MIQHLQSRYFCNLKKVPCAIYYTRNIRLFGIKEESCTNLLPMEMLWMAEGEDKFGGCEIGARERGRKGRRRMQPRPRRRWPLLCRKEGGPRPRKSGMESRTYGWEGEEEEAEVARSVTGIP